MGMLDRLPSMMFKRKYIGFVALLSVLLLFGCGSDDVTPNNGIGNISGLIDVSGSLMAHPNGFKVSLQSTIDPSLVYIAVSDANGYFSIEGIEAGTYSVNAEKDGYKWVWMVVDDQLFYFNRLLTIESNQTKQVEIRMASDYEEPNDGLDITDLKGNPITKIVIPRNASTISIRLYNGGQVEHTWQLFYDKCFVSTLLEIEYVFTSFNVSEGTVAPGDNIVLVGQINPKIFDSQFEYIDGWLEIDDYSSLFDLYNMFDVVFE